jgi:hypothetical protein
MNSDATQPHIWSCGFRPAGSVFIGSGPDHCDSCGHVPGRCSRDSGFPHSAGFDLLLADSTEAIPIRSKLGLPFLVRLGQVLVSMGLLVSLAGIVALLVLVSLALVVLDFASLDLLSRACRHGFHVLRYQATSWGGTVLAQFCRRPQGLGNIWLDAGQ